MEYVRLSHSYTYEINLLLMLIIKGSYGECRVQDNQMKCERYPPEMFSYPMKWLLVSFWHGKGVRLKTYWSALVNSVLFVASALRFIVLY